MKKHATFGECLAAILNAIDLKCSKLAKDINVDPSLIYKWLRDERVPSYDTPYIELISNFIANKVSNKFQMKAIADILDKYGIETAENGNENLKSKISVCLREAQGYSIELRKKNRKKDKSHNAPNVAGFLKHINTNEGTNENNCRTNFRNHDFVNTGNMFCGIDNVQIISGHIEVIYSTIMLLKQAHRKPDSKDGRILITFSSEMDILLNDNDLRYKWIEALQGALICGWNIIFQLRLNNNISRTIKIIEDMQSLLPQGNLTVYYHKVDDDVFILNELCVIPDIGALLCFSSKTGKQADRAFWYHEKESIDTLTAYFFQQLTFARPLMKAYPSQKTMEFQQALAEAEEAPGARYIFKNGLSTITIPLNLYEKYLRLDHKTNQEISYRMFLHKKRLEAFETHVKYYEFKDICFIESLEKLAENKKYPFDESYMPENRVPGNEDIVGHLENLICMLKKYDNYEIAFVSQKDFYNLSDICWTVMENSSVIIKTLNKNKTESDNNSYNTETNFIITEKSIVNAFHDYFLRIWNELPERSKDKGNAVNFLQSLINKCKSEENKEN